ncbi:hypothetical protein ACFL1D_00060 [Candidatus Omnitrophota bacterium]
MRRKKKGQSVLEYVIVLTAIIAAVVVAARTFLPTAVDTVFTESKGSIEGAAGRLPD